jgi:hypothetical protein
MEKIEYINPGTHLFRFMDPRAGHFWSAITDMLSEQKLYLNSRTRFNDPYDSQPVIDDDLRNSAIRAYLKDMLENPFNPARSTISTARILEMRATGKTHLNKEMIENIRLALRKNASEILDTAGLLSFSMTAENPLLWAHYADSFKGLCAIFRRGELMTSILSTCAKVNYVNKRQRLSQSLLHELTTRQMENKPSSEVADKVFFLSFLHKSSDWAYEQEARIFYPFHAFKKLPFDPNELIGFILGPNFPPELESKLKQEIAAQRPTASVYRSSLSTSEFQIVVPRKFAQHSHSEAA